MGTGRLKNIIKNLYQKLFKIEETFECLSFSQEGEDLILNRFLENKKTGFYVDVGAHHPKRFSNTYKFYRRGWQGINIDAMPGSMIAFNELRPRDVNLEIGISKLPRDHIYYMFNEPALNTFSITEAKKKDGLRDYKIIETKKIETLPLKDVLAKYLKENQEIDFLTIDVEGLDLQVLESNDWEKYRSNYILIEDLEKHSLIDLPIKSDVYIALINEDYSLVAKTFNTLFFKDNRS